VRWPVLPGVNGEGLLMEPTAKPTACVVAIPDADGAPESLAGDEVCTTMAANGVRVVIPTLINRQDKWSGSARLGRFTNQTHREFVYRMAFEMGRHVIGYELDKVLSAVDWFCQEPAHPPIGVCGYGEGGLLALYSAAIDTRIDATVVNGHFQPREKLWEEPIYRNVWTLLREFGDAEIARLVAPRTLIIEPSIYDLATTAPKARDGRAGAAPGILKAPSTKAVRAEFDRVFQVDQQAQALLRNAVSLPKHFVKDADLFPQRRKTTVELLMALSRGAALDVRGPDSMKVYCNVDPEPRQHRQFDELVN
jgi:dienelactone hydrolase